MNLDMDMEMEMNNMDFDMHLFDTVLDMDLDIPVLIDFNHEYINDIFNEVTFDDDLYIVKQHLKIIIFLTYMKNQDIYQFNRPELIKKIKIMRDFIEFKLLYHNIYYINYRHVEYIEKSVIDTLSSSNTLLSNSQNKTIFSINRNNTKISYILYKQILNIHNTEKNIKVIKNVINTLNLSTQLDLVNFQYFNLNKKPQSNLKELNYKVKEFNNFNKNIIDILRKTEKLKYNYERLEKYKHREKRREYERQYCKNTILLNVDLMCNKLDNDIINNIRSFVGEELIEGIRILGVQEKYFKYQKKVLKEMLSGWKREHLSNYIKDHYYMMYSFNNIQPNIYDYDGEDYMEYFYSNEIDEMYKFQSLPITNIKNSKKKYIDEVLEYNNIIFYYKFQRDIYIISKILKENKLKKITLYYI
jgi:hypothetical protein